MECTLGWHTGTQYTQDQTPDISKCRDICAEAGRPGFAYGTVKGMKVGEYVSDGGRANDCICVRNLRTAPSQAPSCRWNVYEIITTPPANGFCPERLPYAMKG